MVKIPSIVIDNRESSSGIAEMLAHKGLDIKMANLNVGDYLLSDRLCIERKTVADFESSIIDGRLFDQIKRLKEAYEFPLLVIEGNEEYKLKQSVINGAIAAIYIEYGIVCIFVASRQEFVEIVANLAKHEQDQPLSEGSLKKGSKAYTKSQFQELVIGGVPGIGPKLAKQLLRHFGSINRIANASVEELMQVEKIGRKKAETIRDTLNSFYE
ncbi:MAG: ERCC4 domain-containing protein [Candidatus Micrarchaeia archaeon]